MRLDPENLISITEVNRNFSKAAKLVDEKKRVVVMKNNKPVYVLIDYETYIRDVEKKSN